MRKNTMSTRKSTFSMLRLFLISVIVFVLVIGQAYYLPNNSSIVYASDSETVYHFSVCDQQGKLIKGYMREDLQVIADKEGDKEYMYSEFNTYPTFSRMSKTQTSTRLEGYTQTTIEGDNIDHRVGAVKGPTLIAVLKDAGVWETLGDNEKLVFEADKYGASMTKSQLNAKRYYFPNGAKIIAKGKGKYYTSSGATSSKVEVPTILELQYYDKVDKCWYTGAEDAAQYITGRLLVGQTVADEQPSYLKVQGIVGIDMDDDTYGGGCVRVGGDAGAWPEVTVSAAKVLPTNGSKLARGTQIMLKEIDYSSTTAYQANDSKMYYTVNNTQDPAPGKTYAYMFNYTADRWITNDGDISDQVLFPSTDTLGSLTLKVLCTGFGKADSPITTLNYSIVFEPVKNLNVSSQIVGENIENTLTWSKISGTAADPTEYVVYRAVGDSEEYTEIARVAQAEQAITVDSISKSDGYGTKYSYKVQAVDTDETHDGILTDAVSTTVDRTNISELEASLSATSFGYDGTAKMPTVTINGLVEGQDYEVAYKNNTNAGTATVTISGKNDYQGTVEKSFAIVAQDISKMSAALSQTNYVYDGKAKTPTVKGLEGLAYTLKYTNNKSIGTASVTITGTGNYRGTIVKTFTINPPQASISKLVSGKGKITAKLKKLSGSVTFEVWVQQKGAKTWTKFKTTKTSLVVKKVAKKSLVKKKTYSFKVRAIKTVSKKTYYGSWSKTKAIKYLQ